MFNRSLLAGSVPTIFKAAYITPLQKKPDLDPADVRSYRPISNLSVLSKLLERLVARQLLDYLIAANLLPELQSAYRAHHSTETAVLKVLGDILRALDSGDLALLTLLDLSAAFDTVDHAVLLRRLKTSYSLDSCVLRWFTSYLNGRTQFVRCLKSSSHPADVLYTECHKDRSLDRSCFYSTQRTFCGSWSQTTFVHICMLMTRRSTLCVIRQTPQSCNSRCLRASTTWRCGCGPIDYSSTRPRPRSSGARRVDDTIKYTSGRTEKWHCVTWVFTSTATHQ